MFRPVQVAATNAGWTSAGPEANLRDKASRKAAQDAKKAARSAMAPGECRGTHKGRPYSAIRRATTTRAFAYPTISSPPEHISPPLGSRYPCVAYA